MSRAVIMAGWDDVPHLTAQDKADLIKSMPVHQREARAKGVPSLGAVSSFATRRIVTQWRKLAPRVDSRGFSHNDAGVTQGYVGSISKDRDASGAG